MEPGWQGRSLVAGLSLMMLVMTSILVGWLSFEKRPEEQAWRLRGLPHRTIAFVLGRTEQKG